MLTEKDWKYLWLVCTEASRFSTCAKRQYMAVLVDTHGHIIGTGYNGGPKGYPHCNEGACPRAQEGSPSGSIYNNCIAIHAEANALLHSDYTARRDSCVLYVNGPPCWDCAKLIANSGVWRIVHLEDPNYTQWPMVREFLENCFIKVHGVSYEDIG